MDAVTTGFSVGAAEGATDGFAATDPPLPAVGEFPLWESTGEKRLDLSIANVIAVDPATMAIETSIPAPHMLEAIRDPSERLRRTSASCCISSIREN